MSQLSLYKNLSTLLIACCITASTTLLAANDTSETVRSNRDHQAGKVRMLHKPDGAMTIQDKSQRPLSDKVANQFAPRFGLRNPASQLRVKKEKTENNKTTIRYRQQQNGIPVFAGELVANVNAQQQLTSMSGEISGMAVINTVPTISAEQATQTALTAISKWHQLDTSNLRVNTPLLTVYDPSLIYDAPSSAQLVWKLEVTANFQAAINEIILVDAHAGGIVLHFNKVDTALNRRIYDANNIETLPGSLLCNEAPPCSGDPDAITAYNFIEDAFDFFALNHGRDGIDGVGGIISATINFPEGAGGPNAFWIGADPYLGQSNIMAFTDGMAVDDVVVHEYTHGVTENESGLIYLSESGAINESLSDIWGEFVDQDNGVGNDTAGAKWAIGEDAIPTAGAIRDMSDPTIFGDPDKMSSPNFFVSFLDNGGVHINSGINNKAAYLMADGSLTENDPNPGEFNGETVVAMGNAKTAKLYYEVQTNHLTTGSDYLDLYNALLAACTVLVGTGDLNAADCTDTVQPALRAVEMDQSPSASYAPSAEVCPVGINVYDLFADNFELNNLNNWSTTVISGTNIWATDNNNLGTNSGNFTLSGRGFAVNISGGTDNDVALQTTTPVRVPSSTTAYIHFEQAFYFEVDAINQLTNYDGGVIEYSIDNGANWNDAGSLIDSGRDYGGTLSQFNPQPSRSAFVRFSNGFNSTRLNLSSLAGEYVLFRFRSLADEVAASGPWTIDNFRFYLCADNAPPIPNAGADQSVDGEELVQLAGSVIDLDGDTVTYNWTQISGTPVTLTGATTLTPTFTSPRSDANMVFELSVNDGTSTEVDTMSVAVQFFFSSAEGGDGGGGCSLNEKGRFDPIWLFLLIFFTAVHLFPKRQIRYVFKKNRRKSNQIRIE